MSSVNSHPAVQAWLALDPENPLPSSIERVRSKNRGSAVYRLSGVAFDNASIIAKRAPIDGHATEETVYRHVLAHLPVPAPRFYGTVQTAGADHAWLFVEDVGGQDCDPRDPRHRVAAAEWLACFHTGASHLDVAHRLQRRDPGYYLDHLRSACAAISPSLGHRPLTAQDDDILASLLHRCESFEAHWHEIEDFFAGIPRTVVHGDFCQTNVCMRACGADVRLCPFDWEDSGWGVPAADLADLPADVLAYGTMFRAVSELAWESWRIRFPYRTDRERVWLTEFVDCASLYGTQLDQVAATGGWMP
jgi:hypothetical protein